MYPAFFTVKLKLRPPVLEAGKEDVSALSPNLVALGSDAGAGADASVLTSSLSLNASLSRLKIQILVVRFTLRIDITRNPVSSSLS
ncbi:predicted protein [Sclerotinia sclerotiorum 1980 UF-70]|uniref:Uncharacterized protein n=1 Tax=Sclerotinia sclerotiorum (strain ATCC 18683 / 1980 / Ss-1) TaxID=665079 RepID=A7F2Z7_SCLS1|nr:predicted protein [Sclerotinia sclerotiorum 1980 UF-70]EDN96089.1 predicted protein [Sclerotinia sclerotiorum 1980 UF-70]